MSGPRLRTVALRSRPAGPFDFAIAVGKCIVILGASGSGKSLFLRLIADLDSGEREVRLDGIARSTVQIPSVPRRDRGARCGIKQRAEPSCGQCAEVRGRVCNVRPAHNFANADPGMPCGCAARGPRGRAALRNRDRVWDSASIPALCRIPAFPSSRFLSASRLFPQRSVLPAGRFRPSAILLPGRGHRATIRSGALRGLSVSLLSLLSLLSAVRVRALSIVVDDQWGCAEREP